MRKEKGFTLIEIVVVLAIIAVLAAFLTPMLFDYLKESKVARAKADVKNIAAAITNFNRDLGVWAVYKDAPLHADNATVVMLVTEGNDATEGKDSGGTAVGTYNYTWLTAGGTHEYLKGVLHDGKLALAAGADTYISAVKKPNEWKGPYMTDFKADSWGNKYYVSTEGLQPGSGKAVFVLSAGPNGVIQTAVSQNATGGVTTFTVGEDDIVYRIK